MSVVSSGVQDAHWEECVQNPVNPQDPLLHFLSPESNIVFYLPIGEAEMRWNHKNKWINTTSNKQFQVSNCN